MLYGNDSLIVCWVGEVYDDDIKYRKINRTSVTNVHRKLFSEFIKDFEKSDQRIYGKICKPIVVSITDITLNEFHQVLPDSYVQAYLNNSDTISSKTADTCCNDNGKTTKRNSCIIQ